MHEEFSAMKEIQIKTTPRFHLTLVRMAIIENNEFWRGFEGEKNLIHCWREYKLLQRL
jgi:hypothetical protein